MSRYAHPSLPPKPNLAQALPSHPTSATSSPLLPRATINSYQIPPSAGMIPSLRVKYNADSNESNDEKIPGPSAAGLTSQSSFQDSATSQMDALTPSSSQIPTMSLSLSTAQRSHSLPPKPVRSSKRKLEETEFQSSAAVSKPKLNASDQQDEPKTEKVIEFETPKSKIISILPTPLPSRRFRKGQTRSLLIPIEQIPVFALPPLPVIKDPILETMVFQHQSMFPKVRGQFEDPADAPAMHYEKLEHVGDSILGMVVTTWLQETKPNLTCGTASRLKSHLVSNATLSHISGLYNLPSKLKGDPHQLPVLRASTDIRAAMLEAYIAAVYFSFPADKRLTEAMPSIDEWLREMYEPLYDFFFTYMKAEYDQYRHAVGENPDGTVQTLSDAEMAQIDNASTGMASLIRNHGDINDQKIEYKEDQYDTSLGILWHIKVFVEGVELGEATRANRKTAKNVAAWEAAKLLGLAEN